MADTESRLRDRLLDRAAQAARHPAVQTGVSALSLLELLHPALRVGLTAAGTGLTSALGARMDHQARVTYERTRDRITALEVRGKFDEDQLRREVEQTGTIVKGLLNAAQDHVEKIDWYADLLAGLVSTDRPDEPLDSAVLLSCVSRLEASSLALARHMYETWRREDTLLLRASSGPSGGLTRTTTFSILKPTV